MSADRIARMEMMVDKDLTPEGDALNRKVDQQAKRIPTDLPPEDGPKRRTWEGFADDYRVLSEQMMIATQKHEEALQRIRALKGELGSLKVQRQKDLDRLAAVSRTRDLLEKRSAAQMAKVAGAMARLAAVPVPAAVTELRITDEHRAPPVDNIIVDGFAVNLSDATAARDAIERLVTDRANVITHMYGAQETVVARDHELEAAKAALAEMERKLREAISPAALHAAAATYGRTIAEAKRLGAAVTDGMAAIDAQRAALVVKMGNKGSKYSDEQVGIVFDTLVAGLPAEEAVPGDDFANARGATVEAKGFVASYDGRSETRMLGWADKKWWLRTIARAQAAHKEGQLADAQLYFEVAILTRPSASLWEQLGHVLRESAQYLEAELAYRRSLELNPGRGELMFLSGYSLEMGGRSSEAIPLYEAAIASDPGLVAKYEHLRDFRARLSH